MNFECWETYPIGDIPQGIHRKDTDTEVRDRLEGTLSTIAIGVLNGAHIIRSHEILQAKKAIAVADAIRLAGSKVRGSELGARSHKI